jgi:hypothetical protein
MIGQPPEQQKNDAAPQNWSSCSPSYMNYHYLNSNVNSQYLNSLRELSLPELHFVGFLHELSVIIVAQSPVLWMAE